MQRGHIHALTGPNGTGKTTCFNLLTKFLEPTHGSTVFNGVSMVAGKKIEFIYADRQNKADVAANKAREWISRRASIS